MNFAGTLKTPSSSREPQGCFNGLRTLCYAIELGDVSVQHLSRACFRRRDAGVLVGFRKFRGLLGQLTVEGPVRDLRGIVATG